MGRYTDALVMWFLVLLFLAAVGTIVLVSAAGGVDAAPDVTAASAPEFAAQSTCKTEVRHDAFNADNQTIQKAANSSANSTVKNTRVIVEQAPGFVRLTSDNPNGYCVRFHVLIDSEVVEPAELGEVEAIRDSNVTAQWHALRNFNTQETYTKVTFTLPPNGSATFAPSEVQIQSLSWAAQANSTAQGVLGRADAKWEQYFGSALEKQVYHYSPDGNDSTSIITVSLRDEQTNRTIEEWLAYSRTDGDEDWDQLRQDPEAPVFYRKSGAHTVQFIFNDPDAEVRFVADPGAKEKFDHQVAGYTEGIETIWESLPIGSSNGVIVAPVEVTPTW